MKEVEIKNLKSELAELKKTYSVLMDLTGVDYIEPIKQTRVHYFLHDPVSYKREQIVVTVKRNEKLPSVVDLWASANWFERELFDLFGIVFEGHPNLTRILMPDDWQGHPLRKDFSLRDEPVEFKHGVKPKAPSEIIPYVK